MKSLRTSGGKFKERESLQLLPHSPPVTTFLLQRKQCTSHPGLVMPSNIEIKARLADFTAFHALFKRIYGSEVAEQKILQHCDTYFNCETGRLKLREITVEQQPSAELIFYSRVDTAGPKLSDYVKYDCSGTSSQLKELLVRANGLRGIVEKTRHLYIVGQTRVHIDQVKNLGDFMELEVMMEDGQPLEEGAVIAHEMMEKLKIMPEMLIENGYIDFLNPGN